MIAYTIFLHEAHDGTKTRNNVHPYSHRESKYANVQMNSLPYPSGSGFTIHHSLLTTHLLRRQVDRRQ